MAQQIRYYKQDGTEYSFSKEAEIKITQKSNADMNIGVPKTNMEQNNQPSKAVQQTALMKFMEFLRENHYYISSEMVDKYWELLYWEDNYSEQEKQEA
jgi:hypothetical protein